MRLSISIIILLVVASSAAADISSGSVEVVSGSVSSTCDITDGTGAAPDPTIVFAVEGNGFRTAHVSGRSSLWMLGGEPLRLTGSDSATVYLGGVVSQGVSHTIADDASLIAACGVHPGLDAAPNNGSGGSIFIYEDATISPFGVDLGDDAYLLMLGGTVANVLENGVDAAGDGSFARIEGGTITGGQASLRALRTAEVLILGGTFNGDFIINDDARVTVVGSGFNFPFGTIVGGAGGTPSGTLTGTLADGSVISVDFSLEDHESRLVLQSGTHQPSHPTNLLCNASDASIDGDDDGLLDVFETATGVFVSIFDTGTSALLPDSDSDGINDGDEVARGSNPNSPPAAVPLSSMLGLLIVSACAPAAGLYLLRDLKRS